MAPIIAQYIIAAMLAAYGAAIITLSIGLFKRTARAGILNSGGDGFDEGDLPGVSIVIPFRNEERNLAALLKSIGGQSYKGRIEAIFVDDMSDDGGVGVIKNYFNDNERLDIKIIYLHSTEEWQVDADNTSGNAPASDEALTPKQRAMDAGVASASHHLIGFTDADIILAPDWAESMVNTYLSSGADLIFGHTAVCANIGTSRRQTGPRSRLFAAFEAYQLEFLFAFAYAISKINLTGSCMGNNLLVVRESYLECGGQRGVAYSVVEDRDLLKLMRRRGYKTAAAEPFRVTARTYPAKSAKEFLRQMTRWAAGGLRPGSGLFAAGLLTLTQGGILILSIIEQTARLLFPIVFSRGVTSGLPLPTNDLAWQAAAIIPPVITIIAASNFFMTWIFLTLSFKKHRSPATSWFYPIYNVLMMLEAAVFGWMMIFKSKISWKGRTLGVS